MIKNFDKLNERVAKEWAGDNGFKGEVGGWVYNTVTGEAVCQGWSAFWTKHRTDILNSLTFGLSAFKTFQDLLDAAGDYRPTMRVDCHWQLLVLATEYNREQKRRGDDRRAYTPVFPKGYPEYMVKLVTDPVVVVGGKSF